MRFERPHKVTQSEAIRRIDSFLDGLRNGALPDGVTIVDSTKAWRGHEMDFSFKAKKWFVQVTVSGVVKVTDCSVVMDCELPPLVSNMVSEDRIAHEFDSQFVKLFPE